MCDRNRDSDADAEVAEFRRHYGHLLDAELVKGTFDADLAMLERTVAPPPKSSGCVLGAAASLISFTVILWMLLHLSTPAAVV